jgi:hypothetical protein
LIDDAVVLVPLAGAVIATVGVTPLTLIVEAGPVPNALVQTTEMLLGPATSGRELVFGVVVAVPLIVQVVPDGIVVSPSTV